MALSEDHSEYFDTDDFAVAATITIGNGSPATVNGIFDAPFLLAAAGLGVEANDPQFLCATADVPGIGHGDTAIINSTTYKVRGVQPDGTGQTLLILEEQ